jgi:prohibitin 1
MKNKLTTTLIVISVVLLQSCAIIQPGEVGVTQRLGKLSNNVKGQGIMFYNPFLSKVITTSIQTNNLELTLSLPSKEGLSITSVISILYKIDKAKVTELIKDIGLDYESIISNIFRSASADVCAQFFAKDMHSGMRAQIEEAIRIKMNENLSKRGIIIEAVLMKSIQLPPGLATSIEQKLQAEQEALRMEFVLKQAKAEAERKIIEAQGDRDAQKILSEGLSKEILELRTIEAFKELSTSPNTKIIITDGKSPIMMGDK